MHFLTKLFPTKRNGENHSAVKMFYNISSVKDFFKNLNFNTKQKWPVVSGNYKVVNATHPIAVCTLTSTNLIQPISQWENIAIVGNLYTPNLGIEKIIKNIVSNPNIRVLVLCGKDSPIFKAGQAIQCLFKHGITSEKRIRNAQGHFPVLQNLSIEKIDQFLKQVELIDNRENIEVDLLHKKISKIDLKNNIEVKNVLLKAEQTDMEEETFIELKPGGKRIPLDYDEKGFFVITTDLDRKEITVKHYFKDNRSGYIIKGNSPESILLAILEKKLVSQMSHAGYLGAELNKAKIAMKFNLEYIQDQPLKKEHN